MPTGSFKADELDQLRDWGTGLQQDRRPEVAAAGKAIVLLIEEVERLHVLLWDERLYPAVREAAAALGAEPADAAPAREDLEGSLLQRVRRLLRRRSPDDHPQGEPTEEAGFHT